MLTTAAQPRRRAGRGGLLFALRAGQYQRPNAKGGNRSTTAYTSNWSGSGLPVKASRLATVPAGDQPRNQVARRRSDQPAADRETVDEDTAGTPAMVLVEQVMRLHREHDGGADAEGLADHRVGVVQAGDDDAELDARGPPTIMMAEDRRLTPQ